MWDDVSVNLLYLAARPLTPLLSLPFALSAFSSAFRQRAGDGVPFFEFYLVL